MAPAALSSPPRARVGSESPPERSWRWCTVVAITAWAGAAVVGTLVFLTPPGLYASVLVLAAAPLYGLVATVALVVTRTRAHHGRGAVVLDTGRASLHRFATAHQRVPLLLSAPLALATMVLAAAVVRGLWTGRLLDSPDDSSIALLFSAIVLPLACVQVAAQARWLFSGTIAGQEAAAMRSGTASPLVRIHLVVTLCLCPVGTVSTAVLLFGGLAFG